jgi:hypothetical protein
MAASMVVRPWHGETIAEANRASQRRCVEAASMDAAQALTQI